MTVDSVGTMIIDFQRRKRSQTNRKSLVQVHFVRTSIDADALGLSVRSGNIPKHPSLPITFKEWNMTARLKITKKKSWKKTELITWNRKQEHAKIKYTRRSVWAVIKSVDPMDSLKAFNVIIHWTRSRFDNLMAVWILSQRPDLFYVPSRVWNIWGKKGPHPEYFLFSQNYSGIFWIEMHNWSHNVDYRRVYWPWKQSKQCILTV